MNVVTCANCRKSVIPLQTGVCPSCGKEMSESSITGFESRISYYHRDLRNSVWAIAFVAFLPTLVWLGTMFLSYKPMQWDGIVLGILAYSIGLSAMAFVGGSLLGQGKSMGRTLAFIASLLLLVNFPIGTVFGIFVLRKLCDPKYTKTLA